MKCRLCNAHTLPFASAKILEKYDVQYFQCQTCQLIQTEQPYWLADAYNEAITFSDVGLVQRNVILSKKVKAVIALFYNSEGRFLDYGGGYGLLVRLMRNAGLDFFYYDPFCENLFAQTFEAEDKLSYELIVAFEVFEHLVDPLVELEKMLNRSPHILFSTLMVPSHNPTPGNWWYYGLEHGQHVALYKRETLQYLANYFGLNLYTNGTNFHLLTVEKINPLLFRASANTRISSLLDIFSHKRSLVEQDYQRALGTIKSGQV